MVICQKAVFVDFELFKNQLEGISVFITDKIKNSIFHTAHSVSAEKKVLFMVYARLTKHRDPNLHFGGRQSAHSFLTLDHLPQTYQYIIISEF